MRTCWVVAVGVALVGGVANAQPTPLPLPAPPPAPSSNPLASAAPSTALPPLLPVPSQSPPQPLAVVPRPESLEEYDHGYHYLPNEIPQRRATAECGPLGRVWVGISLDFAFAPARPAPTDVRLRIPNFMFDTIPGPVLPVTGRSSGRFEAALNLVLGCWFDDAHTRGVDASFFFRDARTSFDVFSPGSMVMSSDQGVLNIIPFPQPLPLGLVGWFPAALNSEFLTTDVNYRQRLFCDNYARLDVVAGYRYAFLRDELYPFGHAAIIDYDGDGDADNRSDAYRNNRAAVSNNFHGGQLGLAGEVRLGDWYLSGSAKVALGATTSKVTATGYFLGADGRVGSDFFPLGGLLPQERTRFAVLPSASVQIGYQLTRHIRLYTGYSFMYLSSVGRLGDALNPANTKLTITDYTLHSISLGTEFRF